MEYNEYMELRAESYMKFVPCGHFLLIAHCFYSPQGRYTHLRHNELEESIAELMDVLCHDKFGPLLQPLQDDGFNKISTITKDVRIEKKAESLQGHHFIR